MTRTPFQSALTSDPSHQNACRFLAGYCRATSTSCARGDLLERDLLPFSLPSTGVQFLFHPFLTGRSGFEETECIRHSLQIALDNERTNPPISACIYRARDKGVSVIDTLRCDADVNNVDAGCGGQEEFEHRTTQRMLPRSEECHS